MFLCIQMLQGMINGSVYTNSTRNVQCSCIYKYYQEFSMFLYIQILLGMFTVPVEKKNTRNVQCSCVYKCYKE